MHACWSADRMRRMKTRRSSRNTSTRTHVIRRRPFWSANLQRARVPTCTRRTALTKRAISSAVWRRTSDTSIRPTVTAQVGCSSADRKRARTKKPRRSTSILMPAMKICLSANWRSISTVLPAIQTPKPTWSPPPYGSGQSRRISRTIWLQMSRQSQTASLATRRAAATMPWMKTAGFTAIRATARGSAIHMANGAPCSPLSVCTMQASSSPSSPMPPAASTGQSS